MWTYSKNGILDTCSSLTEEIFLSEMTLIGDSVSICNIEELRYSMPLILKCQSNNIFVGAEEQQFATPKYACF